MLAQQEWFLEQVRARPDEEPLVSSVVAVCVEGEWPQLRRQDMKRVQTILKREPDMVDALNSHLATTLSTALTKCLRERAPKAAPATIKVVADLAVTWIDWGIRGHIRDGQPVSNHCRTIIASTSALIRDLGRS